MRTPLKAERQKRGWSLDRVAKLAKVKAPSILRAEKGEVSRKLAQELTKVFGAPITEMQILYPERYMVADEPDTKVAPPTE